MQSQGGQRYRVRELEIDTAQRCVRGPGGVSHPRARTFDLLVYLIERRHRVVSREELMEALWPGVAVTGNSVMQCVTEARKALADDPRNPRFILTVSKAGYQFVCEVGLPEAPVEVPSAPPSSTRAPAAQVSPRRSLGWPALALTVAAAAIAGALALHRGNQPPPEPPWFEAAWWKLDEGTGIRVGESVGGRAVDIPAGISWTSGVSGSALRFDGAEVAVVGETRLPRGSAPRTLLAHVRVPPGAPDAMTIFQQGHPQIDSGTDRFALGVHVTGVATFSNGNIVFGRSPINDGRWHQVAGVFEGGPKGLMRLYVDGAAEASAPAEGGLSGAGESRWSIGNGLGGLGTPFRGAIDDVRVFARALRTSELMGLHRCQSGATDVQVGRQGYFFSPVFGDSIAFTAGNPSTEVRNLGNDYSGVALARPEPGCRLISVHGADLGQDLRIEAELLLDAPPGNVTEAGPYFRSRGANPGDGIAGGASAGFWVQLLSTGQVRVQRLNPMSAIAFSEAPPSFDASRFHHLAADVKASSLEVQLDRRPVLFDVGGARQRTVPLDPKWETTVPPGRNRGSVGIAFGASRNRSAAGGQRARRITVHSGPAMFP